MGILDLLAYPLASSKNFLIFIVNIIISSRGNFWRKKKNRFLNLPLIPNNSSIGQRVEHATSSSWVLNACVFAGRLPKWFGERPGKKKDDPETPEEEELKKNEEDEEPFGLDDEEAEEEVRADA